MDGQNAEIIKFNEWFSSNYNEIVKKFKHDAYFNSYEFSHDILHQTYLNIISSLEGGSKLKYSDVNGIWQYMYIALKHAYHTNSNLSFNKNRDDNFDMYKINNELGCDDFDEVLRDEERFQNKYNFLVKLEWEIKKKLGKTYSELLTRKINGGVIDVANGERRKWEEIKRYIKTHYQDEYNKIIIKNKKI